MVLYVSDFKESWALEHRNEIPNTLLKSYNGYNLFFFSHSSEDDSYPLLSVLKNETLFNINYNDGDRSFNAIDLESRLDKSKYTLFRISECDNPQEMPNPVVVTAEKALEIIEEFFDSSDRPRSVQWEQL